MTRQSIVLKLRVDAFVAGDWASHPTLYYGQYPTEPQSIYSVTYCPEGVRMPPDISGALDEPDASAIAIHLSTSGWDPTEDDSDNRFIAEALMAESLERSEEMDEAFNVVHL